jgi:hypothetical protein
MKKIRNIKQLRAEQKRLHARQTDLELRMRESWGKIRKMLKPQNVVKNLVAEMIGNYMMNHMTGKLLVSGGAAIIKKAMNIFT